MRSLRLMLLSAVLAATFSSSAEAQGKVRSRRPGTRVERDFKKEASIQARLPFISDVRVVPSASNAVISFKSSERTPPLVEVGRVPPAPDRFGIMAFPLGTALFTRFIQPQDGRYTLDINVSNEQLEAATTYYYIINVFNDNRNDLKRAREQEVGQFTTLSQTVKVIWEKIFIIDDSDEDSAGEISLWFWTNYGHPEAKWQIMNNLGKNRAHSGQTFGVGPLNEHVIENAPNDLSLSVSGVEDDVSIFGGVARGTGISPPLSGPSKDDNFEWNVASETFDLTRYPSEVGETRSYQFKLVSMPNGGYLGRLSFEVHGRFEITRHAR